MVGRAILTPERLDCLCGIAGGQSDTGAVFPSSTSVFTCQYHPTIAPYSLRTNKGKGKGKGHPTTGHEGPEGE
jgi:hypothetical protein